jgi:hypothetical protein
VLSVEHHTQASISLRLAVANLSTRTDIASSDAGSAPQSHLPGKAAKSTPERRESHQQAKFIFDYLAP